MTETMTNPLILKALGKIFKRPADIIHLCDNQYRALNVSKFGQYSANIIVIECPTSPFVGDEDVCLPVPLAHSPELPNQWVVWYFNDTQGTIQYPIGAVLAVAQRYGKDWLKLFPDLMIPYEVLKTAIAAEEQLASH